MNTISANTPNAVYEPYAAAAWLVNRRSNSTIRGLVGRLDAWNGEELDEGPGVDLRAIAEAINDADRNGVEWKAYEERRPAPYYDDDDPKQAALYDAWLAAGPKTDNPRADAFGPMSGGEKRMLRMLAVLEPSTRVRFNLGDSDGVDQGYKDDWRRLVAGGGSR